MDSTREALRRHVLEYSVKRGAFTLKSGVSSSWFVDTKQTACRPEGILAVADEPEGSPCAQSEELAAVPALSARFA